LFLHANEKRYLSSSLAEKQRSREAEKEMSSVLPKIDQCVKNSSERGKIILGFKSLLPLYIVFLLATRYAPNENSHEKEN
jgi:hypothetical protein